MVNVRLLKKCFHGRSKSAADPAPDLESREANERGANICTLEGMINVNKKCSCGRVRPSFGISGCKPSHCKLCRSEEMVDVVNKRCDCGQSVPSFGISGGQPSHCKLCKSEEMVNVRRVRSIQSMIWNFGLQTNVLPKYTD